MVVKTYFDDCERFAISATSQQQKPPSRRCGIPGEHPKTRRAFQRGGGLLNQKLDECVLRTDRYSDAPRSRNGQTGPQK